MLGGAATAYVVALGAMLCSALSALALITTVRRLDLPDASSSRTQTAGKESVGVQAAGHA